MEHQDRFERGIENILGQFDLRLSKPKCTPNIQDGLVGYFRECELKLNEPASLMVERVWESGCSELSILDFSIVKDCGEFSRLLCHVNLSNTGSIFLDLNFYDFDKLRNYTPDPSLVQLMKRNKGFLEGEDSKTGKTLIFEMADDGSYKKTSPLYLNSVRNMLLNDVLYEDLYRHDKKKFDEMVCNNVSRGDAFLQDLAVYFYKSRKDLGFTY